MIKLLSGSLQDRLKNVDIRFAGCAMLFGYHTQIKRFKYS